MSASRTFFFIIIGDKINFSVKMVCSGGLADVFFFNDRPHALGSNPSPWSMRSCPAPVPAHKSSSESWASSWSQLMSQLMIPAHEPSSWAQLEPSSEWESPSLSWANLRNEKSPARAGSEWKSQAQIWLRMKIRAQMPSLRDRLYYYYKVRGALLRSWPCALLWLFT